MRISDAQARMSKRFETSRSLIPALEAGFRHRGPEEINIGAGLKSAGLPPESVINCWCLAAFGQWVPLNGRDLKIRAADRADQADQ
jgi:hypothetical protein